MKNTILVIFISLFSINGFSQTEIIQNDSILIFEVFVAIKGSKRADVYFYCKMDSTFYFGFKEHLNFNCFFKDSINSNEIKSTHKLDKWISKNTKNIGYIQELDSNSTIIINSYLIKSKVIKNYCSEYHKTQFNNFIWVNASLVFLEVKRCNFKFRKPKNQDIITIVDVFGGGNG